MTEESAPQNDQRSEPRNDPQSGRSGPRSGPSIAQAGDDGAPAGGWILRFNLVATGVFAVTAVGAALLFTTPSQWVGAITAMTLFAAGVATFLWSYWTAVQRSRVDQIAVTQLYLLMGAVAPRRVRRLMLSALAVQVLTATVTALARPNSPDGRPGSSLALGFLVPMLGFGLNGLWASVHGRFRPRGDLTGRDDRARGGSAQDASSAPGESTLHASDASRAGATSDAGAAGDSGTDDDSDDPMGQNADHG